MDPQPPTPDTRHPNTTTTTNPTHQRRQPTTRPSLPGIGEYSHGWFESSTGTIRSGYGTIESFWHFQTFVMVAPESDADKSKFYPVSRDDMETAQNAPSSAGHGASVGSFGLGFWRSDDNVLTFGGGMIVHVARNMHLPVVRPQGRQRRRNAGDGKGMEEVVVDHITCAFQRHPTKGTMPALEFR
ncbi:hypothetical protein BJX61DRAFT_542755 [Aspergillus egyptiacus]|nr:hypothetical protein BJX61DRAFT_542755 [Aspergillus egyptiacus]